MAIAPPITLRSTAGPRGALPSAALVAPVATRAASTATIVTTTRTDAGTSVMASKGNSAPTVNEKKLAPAACQGLASCSGSMPSSASAWAASASWAVSCAATCRAEIRCQPFRLVQACQLLQFGRSGLGELSPLQRQQRAFGVALAAHRYVLTRRHGQ